MPDKPPPIPGLSSPAKPKESWAKRIRQFFHMSTMDEYERGCAHGHQLIADGDDYRKQIGSQATFSRMEWLDTQLEYIDHHGNGDSYDRGLVDTLMLERRKEVENQMASSEEKPTAKVLSYPLRVLANVQKMGVTEAKLPMEVQDFLGLTILVDVLYEFPVLHRAWDMDNTAWVVRLANGTTALASTHHGGSPRLIDPDLFRTKVSEYSDTLSATIKAYNIFRPLEKH